MMDPTQRHKKIDTINSQLAERVRIMHLGAVNSTPTQAHSGSDIFPVRVIIRRYIIKNNDISLHTELIDGNIALIDIVCIFLQVDKNYHTIHAAS